MQYMRKRVAHQLFFFLQIKDTLSLTGMSTREITEQPCAWGARIGEPKVVDKPGSITSFTLQRLGGI